MRPLVLAQALDPGRYEVHYATSRRYLPLVEKQQLAPASAGPLGSARVRRKPCGQPRLITHELDCMSTEEMYARIAAGRPLYAEETLRQYAKQELALFARVAPDLVVGDLRLSLGLSCGIAKLPYLNLVNAYWSPYSVLPLPVPDLWMTRLAGRRLSRALVPLVLWQHARVHQRLRHEWGLSPIAGLMDAYTRATWTLYPDLPELVPTKALPANHRYLGPILWEPQTNLGSCRRPASAGPCVYVSTGAGASRLQAVAAAGVRAAGGVVLAAKGNQMLPGIQAAGHSDAVVCHGGSGTVYQALSRGVPVVGLVTNPDQMLSMQAVERAGAGISLLARTATPRSIAAALRRVWGQASYRGAAQALMARIHARDARQEFTTLVDEILPSRLEVDR